MNASDYRRIAREKLKNNWGYAIAAGIIAAILGGLLTGTDFVAELNINIENENIESLQDAIRTLIRVGGLTLGFASLLSLVHFFIGGVAQIGYASYLLKQHDGESPTVSILFEKFSCFGAGFMQQLLRSVYTLLWSLLFIIPGIVAAYSYAMTPFIMAEHPEMSASDAIAESKAMMYGHRFELFCLELSFIGWSFLCGLTANLGYIILNPYTNAARAAFYRNLQPAGYTAE